MYAYIYICIYIYTVASKSNWTNTFLVIFFIELTFLNEILHKHVKIYYNYEKENKNPILAVITQNFSKRMEMISSKIIGQIKYVKTFSTKDKFSAFFMKISVK